MEISEEQLRINYSKMHEVKLRQLLFYEYEELSRDAQIALLNELKSRDLHMEFAEVIKIREGVEDGIDYQILLEQIRKNACPKCTQNDMPLNANMTYRNVAYIVGYTYTSVLYIACPRCLKERLTTDQFITVTLGWWSLPLSPFRTVKTLINNYKTMRLVRMPEPSAELQLFTVEHRFALIYALRSPQDFTHFLGNHPESV